MSRGAAAASLGASAMAAGCASATAAPSGGMVRRRELGDTGLKVSEIGFGGHSWSYARVPDLSGGHRKPTIDEAVEMIAAGLDMGVNVFDSCTPAIESETPGEALRRLGRRDEAVVSVRVSHKMLGRPEDKQEVYKWTEDRLRMWQTDRIDLLMLSNESHVTERSGYWDMSYSIEALEKLKQQGKIRFTGFGSHFDAKWFVVAFQKFGKDFDCCSMPYNIRHRVAEQVMPLAKKVGLGVVTIKPFARGSLLKGRDLEGADKDLPREMIAAVLQNQSLDCCLCGVHTIEQMRQNFSASWTKLTETSRDRLEQVAATAVPHGEHCWMEQGWRYA